MATPPDPADLQAENAKLQQELDEARAAAKPAPTDEPEAGSAAAADTSPLDALKAAIKANPEGSITDHLKQLADDGVKAAVSPQIIEDVVGALAAVVHDLIGKVKL